MLMTFDAHERRSTEGAFIVQGDAASNGWH